jgi:hypothetical protein
MREIRGRDAALAVLTDTRFVAPPVPAGVRGIGWLRATVGRFASGDDHARRRALSVEVIASVAVVPAGDEHPVAVLARGIGIGSSTDVVSLVRAVAQAYQPGTGDMARADAAVEQLVELLGGAHDEVTAARIGVLAQACDATAVLIARARERPVAEVLRDDPPVPATKRQATEAVVVDGVRVEAGEVVLVSLADGLAFGAGPRQCPGRELALGLVGSGGAGLTRTGE